MNINDLSNPWFSLLQRYRKGKRIEKGEVLALLRSDVSVIDEAKPFIADVIEKKFKFQRGIKTQAGIKDSFINRSFICSMVDTLEEHFKAEKSNQLKGADTPREEAKKMMADDLGICVRSLEGILGSCRNIKK